MKKKLASFALVLVLVLGFGVTVHAELGDKVGKSIPIYGIFPSTHSDLGDGTGK